MGLEPLMDLLDRIRKDRVIYTVSEQAICQGVILPILGKLGWDRDNIREVIPEFSVGNGRVDYCLKIADKKHVFIEAKRPADDLQNHQEQLRQYAF
jgi:predicted type IV restriction endonuclease